MYSQVVTNLKVEVFEVRYFLAMGVFSQYWF